MGAVFVGTHINALEAQLREGIQHAQQRGGSRLVSVAQRTPTTNAIHNNADFITIFARASAICRDRFFWAQPDEDYTLVGIGAAQIIEVVGASRFRQAANARQQLMERALIEGPRGLPGVGPLFFCGFAFDPQRPATTLWQGYSDGRLVLPRLMFTKRGADNWLTYNVMIDQDTDADVEADSAAALYDEVMADFVYQSEFEPANGTFRQDDLRPAADWKAEVAYTANAVVQGKLEKAVLARAVRLHADQPFAIGDTLYRLTTQYPDCTVFAVGQTQEQGRDHVNRCFMGATPERLVSVQGGQLRTMSLAGSTRRGMSPTEDRALGEALLTSAKDRREHAVVAEAIIEVIRDTCNDLHFASTPELLKLRNVQHLCTPITGHLAAGRTLLDVVERLHPTPAVGGRPREIALDLIREHEGMDRGWYAGPIGWIDGDGDGEFSVALRSALVQGDEAILFAGCGIVADSDPEREYDESCLKLKPMLSALTGR